MVHYPQMRSPEYTFPPEELYLSEFYNRVKSKKLEYGAVYTAVSKLKPVFSRHTVMTFPVLLERDEQPIKEQAESLTTPPSELAVVSFKLILLDEDYRPKDFEVYHTRMKNGYWDSRHDPLTIKESGAEPILGGFLLKSLPGDYTVDDIANGIVYPLEYDQ
jgi:hypothetical protein